MALTHLEQERSTTEVIRDIIFDIQEMIHSEVQLVKAEARETAQRAGRSGGMAGGAALCGFFAVACFLATCIAAMSLAMPVWLATLLIGIGLACAGWALYIGARNRWQQVHPFPQRTVQTLKDSAQWAKHRTS
jgi:hypothetical protein